MRNDLASDYATFRNERVGDVSEIVGTKPD
jgi:hypothetical protein